jgi:ABC-type branched-subunit amino acid transport system ATPase component
MSAPILALDKISKRFGAIVIAYKIDLALAEGESLGIIGPNGAGKTTLFGIINGIPWRRIPAACSLRATTLPTRRRRNAARSASAARSRFRCRLAA